MIYHEKCAMFISGLDESWEVPVSDPEIMVCVYDHNGMASSFADVTVKDRFGNVATFPVSTSPVLRSRAELWAEQQRELEAEHNLHGNKERI